MQKWKERWNEMRPYEKGFLVATCVFLGLALAVGFIEVMILIGVEGRVLEMPAEIRSIRNGLMALMMGCLTVTCWRRERSTAILYLVFAIWWGLDTIWEIMELFL